MSSMLLRNGLVINGVTFICYFFVGLALFRCWKKNPSNVIKHRIFKSLAAIMTLVVGTYFAICLIALLLSSVNDPIYILHILPSISALLTVTATSSNGPLLMAFSTEYQQAFRKYLRSLPLIGICSAQMAQQQQQQLVSSVSMIVRFQNVTHQTQKSVGRVRHGAGGGTVAPKTIALIEA